MNTTTTLPAPANGDTRYSIVTLAELLCVAPASVDALLTDDEQGDIEESPDLHSARSFVTYRASDGAEYGDCWLTDEAAERIASELPVGLLARRVVADIPEAAALLGWDQIHALAQHIVTHGGAS
jgi:hypothetical protein